MLLIVTFLSLPNSREFMPPVPLHSINKLSSLKLIIALVVPPVNPHNDTSDEHLIIEARTVFNKLNKITISRLITEKQNEIEQEISKLESAATKTTNPKARYYIYKVCDLYAIVYKKPADRVPYLKKMLEIIDHEVTDITEREKALTHFKIADNLYDENKIEEAHKYIYDLYVTRPESFKGLLSGYHLLIETAILLKKYDLAESILNTEFNNAIADQEDPFCSFAHLNYTKLYLHKGDYEKAIAQIIELKKIPHQLPNAMQEAKLRMFENIYFFLIGDMDYAAQLIPVNKVFFDDSKILDRSSDLKQIVSSIDICIDAALHKKPLPRKTFNTIQHLNTGPNAIFGVLLMRMALTLPKSLW